MKNRILTTLVAAGISITLVSCGSGNSKEQAPKKIEVTGSAEMEVVPDEIYMTFSLREYLGASKVKVKLDDIKAAFLGQCKASGIPDSSISVSGYAGYERWDYYFYRRRKTEPDFMNSISYTIKVSSTSHLDKLIATLDEKAVENFNISKTSHSRMEQLRKEVKQKALLAGKEKADYLAKAIGEDIGEAILIQEIDNSEVSDYSNRSMVSNEVEMYKSNDGYAATSSPSFEKIKIRYEMKAEFKLK